jgi:prevent-host-death family protein
MITYAKEEMIGITEFGKSLGKYLDKVTLNTLGRLVIVRRNRPEAIIIPIQEYENLQKYMICWSKEI